MQGGLLLVNIVGYRVVCCWQTAGVTSEWGDASCEHYLYGMNSAFHQKVLTKRPGPRPFTNTRTNVTPTAVAFCPGGEEYKTIHQETQSHLFASLF
jgi:hypothetical protein